MRRIGLVFVFALIATAVFAACGGSAVEEDAAPESAAIEVVAEPTFIRVTVTPVPIDTPRPTIAPTVVSKFTAEQLADPVFPDWLDPELNDEQPDDEVVFAGWQEFLTNTDIAFTRDNGSKFTAHFCSDGFIVEDDGEIDEEIKWGASRTAAMSSRQWGKVAITVEFLAGERAGITFTYLVISREGGMVMQTGWTAPTELLITRSKICLEAFPPESDSAVSTADGINLDEPVFPDWLDPEIADERPTNDAIFAGWVEYLTDVKIIGYLNDRSSLHL